LQVLEKLVDRLLSHMSLLQQILDNVALLDMLLSFFHAVGGNPLVAQFSGIKI
jgi:DNA mismatch repair ATPase MutS